MSIIHGTYGGYQQHQRRGETSCTPCKDASMQYRREYRAGSVDARRKDRWWNNTRKVALERLAAEYPQRFGEILEDVRATETRWLP